jgi:type II secretory pathway pseudopilin PulG
MSRRAFTITELLVVIGVIVVIAGVLLAALSAVKGTSEMADSMNRMRQIGVWMRAYSVDNRDIVLPSTFNYNGNPYPGKVRTGNLTLGGEHRGTWADILWSENSIAVLGNFEGQGSLPAGTPTWRHDSPDEAFYDLRPDFDENPLRSSAPNTRNAPVHPESDDCGDSDCIPIARPFGHGAQEAGLPGYFAANNYFAGFHTNGQIRRPDQSMYLVDSFYGEVIKPDPHPFCNHPDCPPLIPPPPPAVFCECPGFEVDFRYNGLCLMLFLDGHVDPVNPWLDIWELEGCIDSQGNVEKGREIRIRNLDGRNRPPCDE